MLRHVLLALTLALLSACQTDASRSATDAPTAATPAAKPVWLFTSFRGSGDGLHLAWSEDGLHWRDLDHVFLKPLVGSGLMRDPQIVHGPDGRYHMVWTSGWNDTGIGYASSPDLIHWSGQTYLPVMKGITGVDTAWAPELYYDDAAGDYIIYWSSRVKDPATGVQHFRAWYTTTRDFVHLSPPQILFDPGFDNIDTTLIQHDGHYTIVFKQADDQPGKVWGPIRSADAESPLGPYTLTPAPLVSGLRVEGPALLDLGDSTLMYADFYAEHHYGVFESSDWVHWADITSTAQIVDGQRHGSIIGVPPALLAQLKAAAAP